MMFPMKHTKICFIILCIFLQTYAFKQELIVTKIMTQFVLHMYIFIPTSDLDI